jgi:hypothetical protein
MLLVGAIPIAISILAFAAAMALVAVSSDGGEDEVSANDSSAPSGQEAVDEAWLGIAGGTSEDPEGVVVIDVVPDGPADEAGIRPADVITAIDGDAVSDIDELAEAVSDSEPGDEVTLIIIPDGANDPDAEEEDVDVTLAARPQFDADNGDDEGDEDEGDDDEGWSPYPGHRGGQSIIGKLGEALGLGELLGGDLRYLDEDGNEVTISVAVGEITALSDDDLTIALADDSEETAEITGDSEIPDGLEEGDEAVVLSKDGEVLFVLGGHDGPFGFLPMDDLEKALPYSEFVPYSDIFGCIAGGDCEIQVPFFKCDSDGNCHLDPEAIMPEEDSGA